jgi:hypothetical protein
MPEFMKKITTYLFILCLWLIGPASSQAQQTWAATGGNALGNGGTISYTVGQSACLFQTGTQGSVTQGVQQSYRITVETIKRNNPPSELTCTLFPNPAKEFVVLKIREAKLNNLSVRLFNMEGRLLLNQNIHSFETRIAVNHLTAGTYLLRIIRKGKTIEIMKLIIEPAS